VLAAALDVAVQAINAPFLLPVQAVGVLLLAAGLRGRPEPVALRTSFGALGGLLATSMAVAFIPQEISDPIGGFRIFGVFAYLLAGLAWSVIGYVLSRRRPHGS
jgi:hypothetical protein